MGHQFGKAGFALCICAGILTFLANMMINIGSIGTPTPSKRMNFRKSSKGGGGGSFSIQKFYVADICHYRRYFGHEVQKKIATLLSENERGGGQRPSGTFPKIHPFWKGSASLT